MQDPTLTTTKTNEDNFFSCPHLDYGLISQTWQVECIYLQLTQRLTGTVKELNKRIECSSKLVSKKQK